MGLLSLSLLLLGLTGQVSAQAQRGHAVVIEFDSIVHPISERFTERALDRAEETGAQVAVIEIDTPGGLLSSTREIVEAIFASRVPVIVFVSPQGARAASAGTFITAAGHIAAMAPGTNIGAASPVGGQGEDIPETLKAKIFEDTAAEIRSIAERRGRAVEPLEATVLEAKAYTANEALELGIIDLIAVNVTELLELVDGRQVTVNTPSGEQTITLATVGIEQRGITMGVFDRFLSFIADPNISFLLISLGGLGLFLELMSPGIIFPGAFGLIALLLGFFALGNLPGSWVGAALIMLGFALAVAEVNVDGFGVLGLMGIAAFILGGIVLFGFFGTPDPGFPNIHVSLWALVPASAIFASGVGGISLTMYRARRHQRASDQTAPALVGVLGTVTSVLGPRGTVRVRGESWTAEAKGEARIERGAEVVVLEEAGTLLTVERAAGPPAPPEEPTDQQV